MMRQIRSFRLSRLLCDETGLALPLVTVSIPIIFGCLALAVDFGYAVQVKNELQSRTDAAALAAAQGLADGTYSAKANLYSASGSAGGVNTISGVSVPAPQITARCSTSLQTAGVPCYSAGNVVQVTQTAQAPLFFGAALGWSAATVSATSTAAAGGGNLPALNVMIIVDTTASMNTNDPACGMTRFQCSLKGVQNILSELNPAVDYVGIEVFPGVTTASAQNDVNCSGNPTPVQYGSSKFSASPATATYSIVGLATCTTGTGGNCYRTSSSATSLNSASNIVKAVGTGSSTGCMKAEGGEGTYYADAISAAQASLAAFKTSLGAAGANTQNVIMMLSDGDANSNASSGQIISSESHQQCHEAVTAANNASAAGTWFFAISYGSPTAGAPTGCSTDTSPTISPYCAMMEMASKPSMFLSDVTPPSTPCPNGQYGPPAGDNVAELFGEAGSVLAGPRLVPNGI